MVSKRLIDPVALLEDLGRIARELHRLPSKADYTRNGSYSMGRLLRQFGSWQKALAAFHEHTAQTTAWDDVREFFAPPGGSLPAGSNPQLPTLHATHAKSRDGRYKDRPACGAPLDLFGLRHTPVNESGVIFLFGALARSLGFLVESLQAAFPDCAAKRMTAPSIWQSVHIEFEYESRNFHLHGHDPAQCDIIVCWRHNWPECPAHIEVISLEKEISRLARQSPTNSKSC